MAPPAHRRTGSSRKAQYSVFFGYIAGALGAALGLVLLIVAIRDPSFMSSLRGIGSDVVAPASRAAAGAKSESSSFLAAIGGYFAAGRQNAELRRELGQVKARLVEGQAVAEENRRLKSLLGLAQGEHKPVAITRLVGSTASSTRRFATLGAGAADGVAEGMPVRSPQGLVGRVLETGSLTARVLLITDGESVVPVRRARDGIPAFAQGRGDGMLQIRLITLGINPLKRGDAFVTSGSGGLYPPGIPVAVVAKVTSDGAIAFPLSDPAASDYVAVEPTWTARPDGEQAPVAADGAAPAPVRSPAPKTQAATP